RIRQHERPRRRQGPPLKTAQPLFVTILLHVERGCPSVKGEGGEHFPSQFASGMDMASDTNTGGSWDRVAAELRACREAQQRAWGDLDNTTLGRYLAGEATTDEQQQIENALDELPELRKLTELVRDVLGESETVVPTPAPSPTVLPFSRSAAP